MLLSLAQQNDNIIIERCTESTLPSWVNEWKINAYTIWNASSCISLHRIVPCPTARHNALLPYSAANKSRSQHQTRCLGLKIEWTFSLGRAWDATRLLVCCCLLLLLTDQTRSLCTNSLLDKAIWKTNLARIWSPHTCAMKMRVKFLYTGEKENVRISPKY